MIYGQETYRNGKLVQAMLDSDDFALYHFNKQSGQYKFEGESYPDDEEIIHVLFSMTDIELRKYFTEILYC